MRPTDKATGDSRSVQSLAIIKNTNQQGFQRCFADVLNQSLVSSVAHADHYINLYYASIDKVLSKLELRFSGNDQEILCALGDICHRETPDKGRTIRKVMGWKGILEPQEIFFRYQIPCMNFFRP